jgi:UV DNA damage endonuclease
VTQGGGVHGDKEAALQRFRKHYKELSDGVKGRSVEVLVSQRVFRRAHTRSIASRLVLENDEFSYSVDDLLPVCEDLNIPLVFGASFSSASRLRRSPQTKLEPPRTPP